jgi:uncharacterized protein YndB with AHSA1/START domain
MDFEINEIVVIEAAPDDVFGLITDIDRLPEWNREIRTIHEQPAALAPGAQWVVEIHAMGTHWPSRSTVVDLDPATRTFAYRSQSDDGNPSVSTWVWRITAHERGSVVHLDASVRPKTFWRRHLFSKIRSRSLPVAVRTSLQNLTNERTYA